MQKLGADALMVVVTLLAAISWMFSKEAVLIMPPILFVAIRFALAGLILAAFSYRDLTQFSWPQLWQSMRTGVVFAIAMCGWIMGLFFTENVGVGAFLTSLGVVFVPIIALLLFKEHSPRSTWLALPVAIIGLACLSFASALTDQGINIDKGHIFYLVSAFLLAIYFNLNARAANSFNGAKIPAMALTSIVLATVGVVAFIVSCSVEDLNGFVQSLSFAWHREANQTGVSFWHVLGWIVVSATIGTAARFYIQTVAQSLSNNSHGVVILVLEPVWTALIAAFWFSESMASVQLLGCVFIFAALLISRAKAVRQLARSLIR